MIQQAVVIKTENKIATVKVQRHSACRECGACQLGSSSKSLEIKTVNNLGAKIGDYVEIEVPTNKVLKASFLVYIIPIITLILGIYIGGIIGESQGYNKDIFSGIIGLLMMAITFLGIRLYDKSIRNSKDYAPQIIKILNERERMVI